MRSRGQYIIGVVTTLLILTTTLVASAQHITPPDLKRYLNIGLDENYGLQIIRSSEQQASNSAKLTNSGMLPTLELSGDYGLDFDNTTAAPSSGEQRYSYTNNDYYGDMGIYLSWTIFDGFDISTNYKRLKELESQSRVETRIAIEDYIAELTAEYYNYIQQQSRLKILNMAVDLSRERLRIVRARYIVGNFSRLDLQQARVDFNTDSASYIKQREVLKSSSIRFNEIIANSNVDAPVSIRDTIITLDTSLKYADLYSTTRENNAYLIHASQSETIANLDYKRIVSRNYPYVTMSTGYNYEYDRYQRNAIKQSNNLNLTAGVSVGFTIFDTTRKSQRRNAQIDIEKAKINREDVELQLRSQLSDLWQAYINNLGLLDLERNNLISATENYEIAMDRYMLGTLSGIEMREAQKSLLDAEDRILQATYNIKICEISLMQISGQVTKYLN